MKMYMPNVWTALGLVIILVARSLAERHWGLQITDLTVFWIGVAHISAMMFVYRESEIIIW